MIVGSALLEGLKTGFILNNAGSKVYTQTLVYELANGHQVEIFSRQENIFLPNFHYSTVLDHSHNVVLLQLVNVKYRHRLISDQIDLIFEKIINSFRPDTIHFGHLNHLLLILPKIASTAKLPTIFTLHDFWLMCPRGRFVQKNSKNLLEPCDGQEDQKCAPVSTIKKILQGIKALFIKQKLRSAI